MLTFGKKGKHIVLTLTMNNKCLEEKVRESITVVMISRKETFVPYVNNISLQRLHHKIYVIFLEIEK